MELKKWIIAFLIVTLFCMMLIGIIVVLNCIIPEDWEKPIAVGALIFVFSLGVWDVKHCITITEEPTEEPTGENNQTSFPSGRLG